MRTKMSRRHKMGSTDCGANSCSGPFTAHNPHRLGEMDDGRINLVKVFSVTKARDRDSIGERVMAWIAANPSAAILKTVVKQSSDRAFHCLSIVLLCTDS